MKLFCFLALIFNLYFTTAYAIGVQKDLNLILCRAGDSISRRTHSGQGTDSLKIVKKMESGACQVQYKTEVEGGYTVYLCELGPERVSLDFGNLPVDKCKKQKSGNYLQDSMKKRKSACRDRIIKTRRDFVSPVA